MWFRAECRWTTKSGHDGYYTGLLAVMWTLNSFLLPLSCGLMLDRSAWCSPTDFLQLHHPRCAGLSCAESACVQALVDYLAPPLRSPPDCSAPACRC